MRRPFLTANWLDLCILSYAVDDELLMKRLPDGLELDRLDGRAFVSLVAFRFEQCRVRGVRWPGHHCFPELNLRFYVRRSLPDGGERRGVIFIREYAPKRLVSGIARLVYNEPYRTIPMRHAIRDDGRTRTVTYEVGSDSRTHSIEVEGASDASVAPAASIEHCFKEHQWGYGVSRSGRAMEYEVRHPVWATHPVERVSVNLDWARLYGERWASLNNRQPDSVVFAAGSAVEVYPARALTTHSFRRGSKPARADDRSCDSRAEQPAHG